MNLNCLVAPSRARVLTGAQTADGWLARTHFDLEAIKGMRKKVPTATVNDVVLTIVGGALRRYLEAKDESSIHSMVAMAPISVRRKDESKDAGNSISAMTAALGTHIEDPVARLHFVNDMTKRSKEISNAIGARELAEASKLAPSMISGVAARLYTRLGLANRIRPFCNTVVSNVPGPPIPIYMNGAKMVGYYGLGPVVDGVGLFHAATSYCGEMAITYTSDRKMMPDPGFYAECLYASYEALYEASQEKPAPRLRHRSHKKDGETFVHPEKVSAPVAAAEAAPKKVKKASKPKKATKSKKKSASTSEKKTASKSVKKVITAKPKIHTIAKKAVSNGKSHKPDDLKLIKGIGPVLEKKLNKVGVNQFSEIASMKKEDIAKIEDGLGFPGRFKRDGWVKQAKKLATTGGATVH